MARILVIDDELLMRAAILKVLGDAGHEMMEALDGEEGIQVYRAEKPDVVITDMMLPERGGLSVIEEIRREDAEVKIIAISALAYDAFSAAKNVGANEAFEKPIDMRKLLEVISTLTGESS